MIVEKLLTIAAGPKQLERPRKSRTREGEHGIYCPCTEVGHFWRELDE
jgi:hypothetical protein